MKGELIMWFYFKGISLMTLVDYRIKSGLGILKKNIQQWFLMTRWGFEEQKLKT